MHPNRHHHHNNDDYGGATINDHHNNDGTADNNNDGVYLPDSRTAYHYGPVHRSDGHTIHNFAPCPLGGRRCHLPHWWFDRPDAPTADVIDLDDWRRNRIGSRWGPGPSQPTG